MAKKRKRKPKKTPAQKRAEVLAWIREYGDLSTDIWQAYRAGQANCPWHDYLVARNDSRKKQGLPEEL